MKIRALILTLLSTILLGFHVHATEVEPTTPVVSEEEVVENNELPIKQYNFDNVIGDPNAKVEIIEYASMSCVHCATFHKEVYPLLKEKYIDTGKVRFRFRDFPLGGPPALYGAMLSHCVPADKYHNFVSALFKTQESWARQKNFIEILSSIAKLGKMSAEDFDSCMKDQHLIERIKEGVEEAKEKYGVGSTPSFVINGTTYSNMTMEKFASIIDPILEQE